MSLITKRTVTSGQRVMLLDVNPARRALHIMNQTALPLEMAFSSGGPGFVLDSIPAMVTGRDMLSFIPAPTDQIWVGFAPGVPAGSSIDIDVMEI